ncbi:subtilisin [Fusarium mexicanum]|uniref:Subtilisin n=1 Tax=Fusarium mexicanum TaxID=751941 RepID=A0A8H5JB17_9HYPO|nr:subtilisin [Fusarium mexicanum]
MPEEPSSSDRAGLLCAVFLRLSPDANTNADLFPNALTSDDVSSWVKIDEQIISKTIRATSHEISAIRRRPDFERVVRIEAATHETTILQQQEYLDRSGYIILPADPGKQEKCKATNNSLDLLFGTNIEAQMIGQGSIYMWKASLSRDQVSQAESLDGVKSVQPNLHNLNRRYIAGRYYIDPLDRENQEQCAEIGTSLARLLGNDNFDPHISVLDGKLRKWMADLSNGRVARVKAIHGVKGVRPIQRGRRCRLGMKSTNGLESQAQQEIRYETQLGAPTELPSRHTERRKKSVVTMSLTLGRDWDEDDNLKDFTKLFQYLFDMDVPLVCISGNFEEGFEEPDVDEYPPLMEGPDLPLIVVGSVDSAGKLSEFSKGGPHVTLHAVGDSIECLPRDSKDPVERAGTSYAAPQVAGEIANLLSYEKVPLDTSDGNLVKNLKAYLQSDAASWERYPGIRVLWNGVREENNQKETVKCNGLETDRYIEREEVKHLIEDEFCPEVSSSRDLRPQNSAISRIYNMDTPNKVRLSVSLSQGDSVSDCVKYLMMTVDDCYRVDNDPSDYKGGGQTIIGDATYEVYPGSLRSPSRYGKQAGCDSTYKFTFNEYWVWGHGWASSDHGKALKKEIKGCALLPDTWKFTYGIGEDGREWTARFRTGVFQKSCIGNAVGKTSGIDDFGCAGSG